MLFIYREKKDWLFIVSAYKWTFSSVIKFPNEHKNQHKVEFESANRKSWLVWLVNESVTGSENWCFSFSAEFHRALGLICKKNACGGSWAWISSVPGTCVFELRRRLIYHRASFRVCPLAGEIIQDLYAGLHTDMGGPRVCMVKGGGTRKTTVDLSLKPHTLSKWGYCCGNICSF